jgi:hypothetical protein
VGLSSSGARRLREAYVSIKKNHAAVLLWLRHATVHLETFEADGHWVIFVSGYDQNASAKHTKDFFASVYDQNASAKHRKD